MKKAIKIEIERVEGKKSECGRHTVTTWTAANTLLNQMSHTAPECGGYDKTDFKVTFDDGSEYAGRVDLSRDQSQNLGYHILEFARFYSGRHCPSHLDDSDYSRLMSQHSPEQKEAYGQILDEYDLDGWNAKPLT